VTGLKTFLTFHIRLFRRLNNIYNWSSTRCKWLSASTGG
jgi:hypothetical protein